MHPLQPIKPRGLLGQTNGFSPMVFHELFQVRDLVVSRLVSGDLADLEAWRPGGAFWVNGWPKVADHPKNMSCFNVFNCLDVFVC